jgi:hypothetical protein
MAVVRMGVQACRASDAPNHLMRHGRLSRNLNATVVGVTVAACPAVDATGLDWMTEHVACCLQPAVVAQLHGVADFVSCCACSRQASLTPGGQSFATQSVTALRRHP